MFRRELSNKIEEDAVHWISALVLAAAMVFVISSPNPAVAGNSMATLNGKVVALDSYGKTLTVRATGSAESPSPGSGGLFTFTFDKMTNIVWCTQNKTFNSLNVGDTVTVSYHEKDGNLIAEAVDISPLLIACYSSQ